MRYRSFILGVVVLALVSVLAPLGRSSVAVASTALIAKGTVTAITVDSLSITTATGSRLTFRLTSTTIYEKNGQAAAQSDVRVGQSVKVKYHSEADGSLKAKKVKIEAGATSAAPRPTAIAGARPVARAVPFQLEGAAIGVSPNALTVRVHGLSEDGHAAPTLIGRRLVVSLSTRTTILVNGRVARPQAVRIGDSVHIAGTATNGVFTARRVIDQRPGML